ncbi:MAG: hypothetical protein ACOH10_11355 [Rhodoglobus sp.]
MNVLPLPAWTTPHEVAVRAITGSGGMGSTYAAPETVPAFVIDERVLVRDASGAEVVSSTQVHLGFDVTAPPGSLVTVWPGVAGEREATVIASSRAAHERLPAYQTLSLT